MVPNNGNFTQFTTRFVPILAVLLLVFALAAACGGGDEGNGSAGDRNVVPTMPPARFDQPTPVTDLTDASEADQQEDDAGDEAAPDIATGEFVYGNRCAECHGEGAAGTDQAGSLVGLSLDEEEFEDLIRTGGELGPDHLFGSTKISPDGLSAVYAYLTSLE